MKKVTHQVWKSVETIDYKTYWSLSTYLLFIYKIFIFIIYILILYNI